jgi:hypothetical protein
LIFVKDGIIVILFKNGQNDVEKEKEMKIQGFSKKILLRGRQNLGNKIRFMLIKV